MARVTCPYCGAVYEAPEGVGYAVCPYCGTTVRVETGEAVPQYYYPPRLSEQDAYAAAISRASQMPGAPRRLAEETVYSGGELHMVPLYICRAEAAAVDESCSTARELVEEPLLATREEPLPGVETGYPFPSAGRAPYSPEMARGAVFHQAERGPEEGCSRLEARAARRAAREASLSGCVAEARSSHTLLGVAHYPFWLIRYRHPLRGEPLQAVVDAVDATVVYAEYPIPGARRLVLAGLAAAAYAAGLAVGAAAAVKTGSMDPLLGSALAATGAALPGLRRAATGLGRYRLRARAVEETVVRLVEKRTS